MYVCMYVCMYVYIVTFFLHKLSTFPLISIQMLILILFAIFIFTLMILKRSQSCDFTINTTMVYKVCMIIVLMYYSKGKGKGCCGHR